MNIILSFIGTLPNYTIDCIHQIRLFYDGPLYLILDDYNSQFIDKLKSFQVNLIDYNTVKSEEFLHFVNNQNRY